MLVAFRFTSEKLLITASKQCFAAFRQKQNAVAEDNRYISDNEVKAIIANVHPDYVINAHQTECQLSIYQRIANLTFRPLYTRARIPGAY
jgi:hypothetical protein